MTLRQPLPHRWLLSDERNDAALKESLAALPHGSGFVFRHYHLAEEKRRARFEALAAIARRHGHAVILSRGRDWGEDGVYGHPSRIVDAPGLRLATAHNADDIEAANRIGADGVFISPVFPTRSHDNVATLGKEGFHRLSARAHMPTIALGGMTRERAEMLGCERWGAIDGLASSNPP